MSITSFTQNPFPGSPGGEEFFLRRQFSSDETEEGETAVSNEEARLFHEPEKNSAPPQPIAATTLPTVTPAKNYGLRVASNGRITVAMTPNGKKILQQPQPLVYRFARISKEDPSSKKRYIGVTQQPQKRVYSHQFAFNHPEKALTALAQEVHDHPDEFVFGIIMQLPEETDGRAEETALIEHHHATTTGYNRRQGGGGGIAQPKRSSEEASLDKDTIVERLASGEYSSPEGRPLIKKKQKLTSSVPKEELSEQNIVYDILYDPTGNKEDRVHHIGYTTTTLGKRLSSHMSCVNNPEGKAALRAGNSLQTLYEDIRQHPDQYSVRIYDINDLVADGATLPDLESAFMEFFQTVKGEKVRNYGNGGRGSVSQNKE